jgi:hypothetical protein
MAARKILPTITAQGSPSIGEFTISVPAYHVTISPPTVPPDIVLIRSLAAARGWTGERFRNMSTARVKRLLDADLRKLEGDDLFHERSRSTYRRAQGRKA